MHFSDTVTLPGVVVLLRCGPSETNRQEQGERPEPHLPHCARRAEQTFAQKAVVSVGERCKTRGRPLAREGGENEGVGRNQRGETDRDAEKTTAATRRGREEALIRARCFTIKHCFQ